MNVFMLFSGSGPLVILTSHVSTESPELLGKLAAKGIDKFLAYEIPIAIARARYGAHFDIVAHDLTETDELRVLDFNGTRALHLFSFGEMTGPFIHDSAVAQQTGMQVAG